MLRPSFLTFGVGLAGGILALAAVQAAPTNSSGITERTTLTGAIRNARAQQLAAQARAERLESQAQGRTQAADRATDEAAALAARVQQAEAAILAGEAELALVARQRAALGRQLEARQEPLLRLAGALQSMASRPVTLSLLQPGSLRDLVHTRAVLASAAPEIRARTAALRSDMSRMAALENRRAGVLSGLRRAESELETRRTALIAMAERERIAASRTRGTAARERNRALALAEEARSIDDLVSTFDAASALRDRLAALPGPLPRPADPARVRYRSAVARPAARQATVTPRFQLPVTGRIVTGFNEPTRGDARSAGLEISPPADALVVAPGSAKVAFAGPYQGYGRIVILEHPGGFSSLLTGLSSISVAIGQDVGAGFPLGRAGGQGAVLGFEMRRAGTPVNPLDYLRP
ncbi:murein hydrolase activator EnvC family protein [Qipengyuania sp.]|uniref:murein hydrolase activator EnvC family protein n=1 Tax=Qipengyuania sp. TaxID=2004515 RepID=UPI003736626B